MVDIVNKSQRSKMMSGIQNKNTRPEVLIRKILHKLGFRFRLHVSSLPGKPDIVLPKHKAVIMVNGCYWHGHDCYLFKTPKTRTAFWLGKINNNKSRDKMVFRGLNESGWKVLIVWECAIKGKKKLKDEILIETLEEWLMVSGDSAEVTDKGIRPFGH